jgi:VanZ family protein
MNITIRTIKTWLPVAVWICCIFILSTDSFSAEHTSRILERILRSIFPQIGIREVDVIHYFVRKSAHLTEYCIMSILIFRSFRDTFKLQKHWRWVFYSLIVITFIAVTDEFHQEFVASRTSSVVDIGIDIVGGVLGQVICLIFYRLLWKREKKTNIN